MSNRPRRTPRAAAAPAETTRPASSRITAAEIPAEPVGELRGAGIPASPVTTSTRRPRPAALEIPDELARWSWPPLLTEITRMHFEGRR